MALSRAQVRSQGQIVLLALVFFGVFAAMTAGSVTLLTVSERAERVHIARVQAEALAEAGIDQAVYELDQNASYAGETGTALSPGTFDIAVSSIDSSTKQITATGHVPSGANPVATKIIRANVSINTSVVSFHYGVQVGQGGASMSNGSQIQGDLFSDGSVQGSGTITGSAVVASGTPPTSLSGVTVNGNAYAHSLSSCTILGDAYYQSVNQCTVAGTTHPGTPDTDPVPLPISAQQISDWEAAASAGGIISGSYSPSGSVSLGPKEIDGDLSLSNGTMLTLTGPVWVRGDISFSNSVSVTVSSSLGESGAVILADVPGNQASEGTISISNGVTITGNGQSGSTVLLLTTKSGSDALSVGNNAQGAILYAANGTASVSNNAHATQITAYALNLNNNAVVKYDAGLQNQSFSNGPGGSWAFIPGTYSVAP